MTSSSSFLILIPLLFLSSEEEDEEEEKFLETMRKRKRRGKFFRGHEDEERKIFLKTSVANFWAKNFLEPQNTLHFEFGSSAEIFFLRLTPMAKCRIGVDAFQRDG